MIYMLKRIKARYLISPGPTVKNINMASILCTVSYQLTKILFNNTDEKIVETCIDHEVNYLLTSVPHIIDMNVRVRDLESRWNPNTIDRYVDCSNEHGDRDLQVSCPLSVKHENTDAINDDLQQELYLKRPQSH